MAVYKADILDIELNTGNIARSFLCHNIGKDDTKADRFGVRVYRDGEAVSLSGCSIQGYMMRPNGTNLAITGSNTGVSGNQAWVDLPQAAYDYEGQFCLALKLIGGGVTGTVRIIDGMINNTFVSDAVAPTAAVPTYQEILSVYDQMVAAKNGSVRFDTDQTLTAAQMTQARGNIEAASESDVSDLKSAINETNDSVDALVNRITLSIQETVAVGSHVYELSKTIPNGSTVTIKNLSNTTTVTVNFRDTDNVDHQVSNGLSPNSSVDVVAPCNVHSVRSYCNNTDWDLQLIYGDNVIGKTQKNADDIVSLTNRVQNDEGDIENLAYGVDINYQETVTAHTQNIYEFETRIKEGVDVTITNKSSTTTFTIVFRKADGTEESMSSGLSPGVSGVFTAPFDVYSMRCYVNNTDWNFELKYGNPVSERFDNADTHFEWIDSDIYGVDDSRTISASETLDMSLFPITYNIEFSDIAQPLSVVGVYGINSDETLDTLATIRDFSTASTFTPTKYYPKLRYYLQFASASGNVTITLSHDSLQARLNKKQDTLVAGANISISGNVISSTGGGTSGTVGRYNVKDFGAVGDGETIDTEAIQNCMTAAAGNGYEVFFPAGTYLIDDTIDCSNVSMIGSVEQDGYGQTGTGGVKIKATTSDGMFRLSAETYTTTVRKIIQNIILDGNGTAEYCISMSMKGADLYGVYCENALTGLKLSNIYNGLFVRSIFNNNKRYGIYMDAGCNNIMFLECLCGGNSRDAQNVYANVYAVNTSGSAALENSNFKFIACELDAPYNQNAYNFVLNDCCVLTFDQNYFEGSQAGLFSLSNVQVLNITNNYFIDVIMEVNSQDITGTFMGNSFKLYNKESGKAICNLKTGSISGGNYIGTGYATS